MLARVRSTIRSSIPWRSWIGSSSSLDMQVKAPGKQHRALSPGCQVRVEPNTNGRWGSLLDTQVKESHPVHGASTRMPSKEKEPLQLPQGTWNLIVKYYAGRR